MSALDKPFSRASMGARDSICGLIANKKCHFNQLMGQSSDFTLERAVGFGTIQDQ